jgi:hypothetical protein
MGCKWFAPKGTLESCCDVRGGSVSLDRIFYFFISGAWRASDLFRKVGQHMLIKRQVGHQPFESGILLFHLPQPPEFAYTRSFRKGLPKLLF